MTRCQKCEGEMALLFTSSFCPKCDGTGTVQEAPVDRRVALALDVLAQVEGGTFVPENDSYASRIDDRSCKVCALGALWASRTGRMSFLKSSVVLYRDLGEIFPDEQLYAMEMAFEGPLRMTMMEAYHPRLSYKKETWIFDGLPSLVLAGAERLARKLASRKAKDKLICIMENVVRNDGEFHPEEEIDR